MDSNSPYNPHDHIKTWQAYNKKSQRNETVRHYPTEYRLYELSMLYPDANFESVLMHLNEEADFVVVQVRLYIGPDYETSIKKTTAFKQGKLSEIDKVESAAQSRCCRNFGISTAHALASAPKLPELAPEIRDRLNTLLDKTTALGMLEKPSKSQLLSLIADTLNISILSAHDLTTGDLDTFEAFLSSKEVQ